MSKSTFYQAKETVYGGIKFKSRNEARWAYVLENACKEMCCKVTGASVAYEPKNEGLRHPWDFIVFVSELFLFRTADPHWMTKSAFLHEGLHHKAMTSILLLECKPKKPNEEYVYQLRDMARHDCQQIKSSYNESCLHKIGNVVSCKSYILHYDFSIESTFSDLGVENLFTETTSRFDLNIDYSLLREATSLRFDL